jgi:hypothetical protein
VIAGAQEQVNVIARDLTASSPGGKCERMLGGVRQPPRIAEQVRSDPHREYVGLTGVDHVVNTRTASHVCGFVQYALWECGKGCLDSIRTSRTPRLNTGAAT